MAHVRGWVLILCCDRCVWFQGPSFAPPHHSVVSVRAWIFRLGCLPLFASAMDCDGQRSGVFSVWLLVVASLVEGASHVRAGDFARSWCATLLHVSVVNVLSREALRSARETALRCAAHHRRLSLRVWHVVLEDLEGFVCVLGTVVVSASWLHCVLHVSTTNRRAHNALREARGRCLLDAM